MPYAKKSYRRRKSYRPGYLSCGKMVLSDAAKALKIAQSMKRIINVEIKNFDVSQSSTAITVTPVIVQLTNIAQGDTTSTRDGAQLRTVSLSFNYTLVQNASASISSVRLMLVHDRQTNQAIYAIGDLLDVVTIPSIFVSPRNLDNLKRFHVLYDVHHLLQENSNNAGFNRKKHFKKNMIVRYDASTPSIADLTYNSLSLVLVGSEATNTPAITFITRLRFVDN